MKKIVDLDKWNEFVSRLLGELNMGAYSTGAKHMAYDSTKWLEAQPDAEEKHGRWKLIDECSNEGVYCSCCSKKVYRKEYANQKQKSPYCPNCGAKMDLGED